MTTTKAKTMTMEEGILVIKTMRKRGRVTAMLLLTMIKKKTTTTTTTTTAGRKRERKIKRKEVAAMMNQLKRRMNNVGKNVFVRGFPDLTFLS